MRCAAVIVGLLLAGCSDPPTAKTFAIHERVSGSYQPNGPDRAALYVRLATYWQAIQAGNLTKAYDFHTHDYQERVPFIVWQRERQRTRSPDVPKPVSIHWTKAAHRRFGPELYALVKWKAGSGAVQMSGQLIWRQDEKGNFWVENWDF